jgi:hypothetical protein
VIGNGSARRLAHTRVGGPALAVGIVLLAGCSSGSEPGEGVNVADFVGHRWPITEVRHGQVDLAIPTALGAWVEFRSDGTFGADDGVNGYGASFDQVEGGFRLVGDVTGSAVGVPGPGGAPSSTLAVIEAITHIVQNHPEVSAKVESGQLEISVSDYRITGVQTPP